jgi:zinc/manganese transport system substrate-binding protein
MHIGLGRRVLAASLVVAAGAWSPFVPSASAGPGEASRTTEPLKVVVTIPVLKDLAERIGGPHVKVVSLMSGLESEHTYSPKPSDLVAIRKARVLLEVGVGLEIWVTPLVRNSGNPSLLVVTTSKGIALIRNHEQPDGAAQTVQDPHHAGNPHVWLDPENAKIMMRHITESFIRVDPDHASDFRDNQAAYLRQLDQLQAELAERLRSIADRRVVVHHPAWPYFARRFGIKIAGEIVSQSGAEPSAHHLQALIATIRNEHIKVIVSEPQLNQKIPEVLARETGARVVVLTPLPGGIAGIETYLDMLRHNIFQLAQALEMTQGAASGPSWLYDNHSQPAAR